MDGIAEQEKPEQEKPEQEKPEQEGTDQEKPGQGRSDQEVINESLQMQKAVWVRDEIERRRKEEDALLRRQDGRHERILQCLSQGLCTCNLSDVSGALCILWLPEWNCVTKHTYYAFFYSTARCSTDPGEQMLSGVEVDLQTCPDGDISWNACSFYRK